MVSALGGTLTTLRGIVQQFRLSSLEPTVRACEALSESDAIDLAVLGQFKSGKSSLLNAIIGEPILPVGVLPLTAVVTRLAAGPQRIVEVTHVDGRVEEVDVSRLGEFVTESGNPGNRRQIAVVDVLTPALQEFPGLRLVDTPGLGSTLAHNTQATQDWMPNVAAAIIAVSVERPLSEQDLELIRGARQVAPRVWVLLTKIDLLSETEQGEVLAFLENTLQDKFSSAIRVLPFSIRSEVQRWTRQLEENVLRPVAVNVSQEREKALAWKLGSIALACGGYIEIGLRAAERADAERDRLRAAVLDETVNAETIHDELRQAERAIRDRTRPAFERLFASQCVSLASQMRAALATELPTWHGSLAQQTGSYESWIKERLVAELTPRSAAAVAEANRLITQAEERFRRIAEAFRDRLGRNIREEMGVAISPVAWEAIRPELAKVDISTSRPFMFDWELLSWVLPMRLVGGLFQRHVLRRLSWEVEKNLTRLVGQWTDATTAAVTDLRTQAAVWVDAELATLDRLLGQKPIESSLFREALETLKVVGGPERT